MSSALFIIIPLISLFFSIFLFLTVLCTKKNKMLWSFLLLLGCFVIWCMGSTLMRLDLYPGMVFWFYVSATGIFAVPFCLYNFMYHYTNRRGSFARTAWLAVWTAVSVANLFGVFFFDYTISVVNGVPSFHYQMTPWVVVPTVLAVWTIAAAGLMIRRNIIEDGIPVKDFYPLGLGVAIMFAGLVLQAFLGIEGLVSDALFCGINAVCLYYALYKKRFITLTPLSSKGPVYFMAILFATFLFYFSLEPVAAFIGNNLGLYGAMATLLVAVLFAVTVALLASALHHLMAKLFVKDEELREQQLKRLSQLINKSLITSEIVKTYLSFIQTNMPGDHAYIFMLDEEKNAFTVSGCTDSLRPKNYVIHCDNPLIPWTINQNRCVRYPEFTRTRSYMGMWEKEKELFAKLQADLVVPSISDGKLVSFTLFPSRAKRKNFAFSEISFLESAASVLAIAFKNASLYATIQNEAQRDALTGLFNRGYFLRQIDRELKMCTNSCLSLLLFSLDDFRLYNELYGPHEGDRVLKSFATTLTAIIGSKGTIARYGGKEFAVSLPFIDAPGAKALADQCREQLNTFMATDNVQLNRILTFSAGVCSYPAAAKSADDLLTYANLAAYSAKKNGKNRTLIYAARSGGRTSSQDEAEAKAKRELADSSSQTIFALTAAIDAKDHYTFNHSNSVSRYASTLAEAIGLDKEHVEIIRQAGLLHDVGKIGIPESILSKPGRLTDEEFEIMKQHVVRSIAIIRYLPSLDYVIPAAIGHHERWDGKGYPRGLSGENIPIGARCLCIADSFDAMISERPYKEPMSVEVALLEIERCLGTQFDPQLGRTFIRLVRTGQVKIQEEA